MPITDLQAFANLNQASALIIFAASHQSPAYEKQMQLLAGQDQTLAEKKLIIVSCFADGKGNIGDDPLQATAGRQLREALQVDDEDFLVVITDEHGAEVGRFDAPIPPETVRTSSAGTTPAGR